MSTPELAAVGLVLAFYGFTCFAWGVVHGIRRSRVELEWMGRQGGNKQRPAGE